MPLVDIHLIEGVFNHAQKQEMIRNVTDAMVGIEGEALRGVTWVPFSRVRGCERRMGYRRKSNDRRRREDTAAAKQPVRAFSVRDDTASGPQPSERFFKRRDSVLHR